MTASPKAPKTNAARALDDLGIEYRLATYEVDPSDLSAPPVAAKIGLPPERVFKTIVVHGERTGPFLALVPAGAELDLKALARAAGDRRAELVPLSDVERITGYVRGGVTALATRRPLRTFVDSSALAADEIAVSAGIRGAQLILAPADYVRAAGAEVADIWAAAR